MYSMGLTFKILNFYYFYICSSDRFTNATIFFLSLREYNPCFPTLYLIFFNSEGLIDTI